MLITYRRTGGLFALLTFAAAAVAATMLAVAVAAALLMVAAAIGSAVLLGRVLLPTSWRNRRTVPTAAPWPHETIDTIAVVTPSIQPTEK